MNAADTPSPTPPQSSPSLSEMLDKVLANPELIGAVVSALKESGITPPSAEASAPASPPPSSPSGDDLAQRLPQIMASVAPMLATLSASPPKEAPHTATASDPRTALLCALKPYLSHSRCEAIDYMVRLGKLSELLRQIH